MRTNLTYSEMLTLTSGAVGTFGTERVYRLNSLYDPDFTGAGHQPYAYDQLSAIYAKYKVHAVTIDLTITDPIVDANIVAVSAQGPNQTAVLTGALWGTLGERPDTWVRPINAGGGQVMNMKKTFPMHVLMALTKSQFAADIDTTSAAISANPSATPWLRLAVANLTAASTVIAYLRITYHAEMYERTVLSQS
jgi:hypothetical protein